MGEAMDATYTLIVEDGASAGLTRPQVDDVLLAGWSASQPALPVDDEAAFAEFMGDITMDQLT